MQFHLVLPGLGWAIGPSAALPALPALAALLGHARHSWLPASAPETWLAARFGLETSRLPYASLRRAGEATPPGADAHWLCVDPVHLHFAREHLLLADASMLAIRRDEADALIKGLNDTFADIGRFEAPTPERWYLALPDEPQPFFHPLADVNGRPVQLFMPEGNDIARWARLTNEIEVWLYNHPVNAAREAAGQRTLNGVWLWGAGPRDMPLRAPARQVQADAPFTRGLARTAGAAVAPADRFRPHAEGGFAHVDSLHLPALRHDTTAWLAGLEALERDWFAPLLAALKAKQIRRLVISAPGDKHSLQIEVEASGLWKFWRKPRPLAELLATAPQVQAQNP